MWVSLAVSMRTARLPSYSREIAHTPLMSVIAAVRPVYSLARALIIRITCVLTWYIDVDTPHICTRAPSPGDAACASERCADESPAGADRGIHARGNPGGQGAF